AVPVALLIGVVAQDQVVDALVGRQAAHHRCGGDDQMKGGMESHLWISSASALLVWSTACSMPIRDCDFTLRHRGAKPGGECARWVDRAHPIAAQPDCVNPRTA